MSNYDLAWIVVVVFALLGGFGFYLSLIHI